MDNTKPKCQGCREFGNTLQCHLNAPSELRKRRQQRNTREQNPPRAKSGGVRVPKFKPELTIS